MYFHHTASECDFGDNGVINRFLYHFDCTVPLMHKDSLTALTHEEPEAKVMSLTVPVK